MNDGPRDRKTDRQTDRRDEGSEAQRKRTFCSPASGGTSEVKVGVDGGGIGGSGANNGPKSGIRKL